MKGYFCTYPFVFDLLRGSIHHRATKFSIQLQQAVSKISYHFKHVINIFIEVITHLYLV